MRFRFMLVLVTTLLILAMLLFNGTSVGVSDGVSDPFGFVGLYAEYECPPLIFNSMYDWYGPGLFQQGFPTAIFLAKYYDTDFYKSIIDRWGDDIIKFWRNRNAIKDPDLVATFLEVLAESLHKRGYTVRYNLSFHVVGFDGEYYDVVLRLKISVVNIKNLSIVLYESPYVEEWVKVSVRDRSMFYKGSYAGVWPFFLLPWEVYEGNNITIAELILYDIFEVEHVIDRMEAILKPEDLAQQPDLVKDLWRYREMYFKEVVGVTIRPENVLTATFWLHTGLHDDLIKQKWGDVAEFIRKWVDAKDAVERKFYESLGFTNINLYSPRSRYPTGAGTYTNFEYDVKSGIAFIFDVSDTYPDVLSYVLPLERYYRLSGSNCYTWYLTSLKFIPPESTGSPEGTVTTSYPTTVATTNTGVESTDTITRVQEGPTTTTPIATTVTTVIQTDIEKVETTTTTSPVTGPMDRVRETGVLPRVTLTQTPATTPVDFVETPTPKSGLLTLEAVLIVFVVVLTVLLVILGYRFLRR